MSNPTNTPAVQQPKQLTPVDKLKAFLTGDAMKAQIMMALPKHIEIEKFIRILMTAVSQNPKLATADQNSLLVACMKAAADGLMPDGKEAALVTFFDKNANVDMVQYMPMYAGILKKMRNSGELHSIEAHMVYKNDTFRYRPGIEAEPVFEPDWFGDRGEAVGVYAVGKTKDGAVYIEIMSISQVDDVRGVSKAKFGPWDGPFASEMAKKSVIRRLAKRMPTSTDVEQVLNHDNDNYELNAPAPAAAQIAAPAASGAPALNAPATTEPAAPKKKLSKAEKALGMGKTAEAQAAQAANEVKPAAQAPAEKTVSKPAAQATTSSRIPTDADMDAAIARGGVVNGEDKPRDINDPYYNQEENSEEDDGSQGEFEDISPI